MKEGKGEEEEGEDFLVLFLASPSSDSLLGRENHPDSSETPVLPGQDWICGHRLLLYIGQGLMLLLSQSKSLTDNSSKRFDPIVAERWPMGTVGRSYYGRNKNFQHHKAL